MNSKNQIKIDKKWQNLFYLWLEKDTSNSVFFNNADNEMLFLPLLRFLHSIQKQQILFIFPDAGMAEENFIYCRNISKDFSVIRDDIYLLPEIISKNKRLSSDLLASFSNAIQLLLDYAPAVFFTSSAALMGFLPLEFTGKDTLILRRGAKINMGQLCSMLVKFNYADECEIKIPGEFSRRGGIVDIFSPLSKYPARIEFFGEQIEDIRLFDPNEQRSLQKVDSYKISPVLVLDKNCEEDKLLRIIELIDNQKVRTAVFFPLRCKEHLARYAGDNESKTFEDFLIKNNPICVFDSTESGENKGEDLSLLRLPDLDCETALLPREEALEKSLARVKTLVADDYLTIIGAKDEEAFEHIRSIIKEKFTGDKRPFPSIYYLPHSFRLPEYKIAYISEDDFLAVPFRRLPRLTEEIKTDINTKGGLSEFFYDFEEYDYVVHNDYGIGIFRGIVKREFNGVESELLQIEFDNEIMTYTEIHKADLISKYSGSGKIQPRLSTIGKKIWKNAKIAAKKGAARFATEMLRTQAVRMQKSGLRFIIDKAEEKLFEKKFPYTETSDQRKASDEIFKDMESPYPMDRLVCGDAGYGKTEVAMRAAFKAVISGKQVAVLVPTTVLAQQHYYTFSERFADYPIVIEMLSRFKTAKEQSDILKRLSVGAIDIIIGTHRLIQKDISFKSLGLLIIDEEQRFGVEHKENLKKIREKVDVLSMSATPIPRTLYMAMTGIRDLSIISSPPSERLPVLTYVSKFDKKLIKDAITYELERGGQVFFLHNRINTIKSTAEMLSEIIPDASVGIVHGRIDEDELEDEMLHFLQGKTQILCCTTIIESGIDVPNANTLIVDRAEKFGLSELYQLRGRVGRSGRQGYAYFLLPPAATLTTKARERIAAIKRHSELSAGFRIAVRDLEIRGSGNIIGTEQSGYINSVGFELYCHYLRMAVAELRGERVLNLDSAEIFIDFFVFGKIKSPSKHGKIEAYIPEDYIDAEILRCRFYRKIANAESEKKLSLIKSEMQDRFGKIPKETLALLKFQELKIALLNSGFNKMHISGEKVEICEIRSDKYLLIDGVQPLLKSKTPAEKISELKSMLENKENCALLK